MINCEALCDSLADFEVEDILKMDPREAKGMLIGLMFGFAFGMDEAKDYRELEEYRKLMKRRYSPFPNYSSHRGTGKYNNIKLMFNTRADGQEMIDNLLNIIEEDGRASVEELYQMAHWYIHPDMRCYGWDDPEDFDDAFVEFVEKDHYVVKFPKPKRIAPKTTS